MSSAPSLSFEETEDAAIVALVRVGFSSKASEAVQAGNYLTVELLDESGGVVKRLAERYPMAFGPHGTQIVERRFPLSRAEFARLRSIQVASVCLCGGSSARKAFSARTVSEARRSLRAEQAERAEQERIAAWRARFPVDDYSNTLLIGDSLMQNATSALQMTLPGVDINADAGRTLEKGGLVFERESPDAGVLDHVRSDDGSHERYVIGTGNNDAGGMSLEAAEEIVSCLGPDKEIYFITEIVVGNPYGTEITNAAIDDVVSRYSNVHKIDWHGLVAGRESEYLSDGTHARPAREPDYAACIKEGLDVVY